MGQSGPSKAGFHTLWTALWPSSGHPERCENHALPQSERIGQTGPCKEELSALDHKDEISSRYGLPQLHFSGHLPLPGETIVR